MKMKEMRLEKPSSCGSLIVFYLVVVGGVSQQTTEGDGVGDAAQVDEEHCGDGLNLTILDYLPPSECQLLSELMLRGHLLVLSLASSSSSCTHNHLIQKLIYACDEVLAISGLVGYITEELGHGEITAKLRDAHSSVSTVHPGIEEERENLPADIHLVQPGGRSGLLQFSELRVSAGRLLLELLQVNIDGVEIGLHGGDGQVAAVPRQTHTPAGAAQVQLAVLDVHLLQLEVHHVARLAHVHQQVPEDAAQDDAQQLQGHMGQHYYYCCLLHRVLLSLRDPTMPTMDTVNITRPSRMSTTAGARKRPSRDVPMTQLIPKCTVQTVSPQEGALGGKTGTHLTTIHIQN
ncbi:hypothetical protein EYF80_012243 [Liparis tanakae]|uniref:Uncharacterized protein n=1 Tax=Liparis tanakae TaxID=230148 RepID=A0A4Z2IKF1_9TELE|nr:hypothetical protein EYF80_012243 [Liparis tanakae]